MSTMDAKTIALVRKLHAMMDSDQGDGEAARIKLRDLLGRHDLRMSDVPQILGDKVGASAGFDFDQWSRDWRAAEERGARREAAARDTAARDAAARDAAVRAAAAAKQARDEAASSAAHEKRRRQEHEELCRKNAAERAAIVARYGSEEAAIAPCERETLLRQAVRSWSKFCPGKPRGRWTASIDRRTKRWEPTERVKAAISEAYPLPTTVEQAIAEEAYWHRRDRELILLLKLDSIDDGLDLSAGMRQHIVDQLIDELPARNVQDILRKLKAQGREMIDRSEARSVGLMRISDQLEEAIIADLERLSGDAADNVVNYQQFRAAGQKRSAPAVKPKLRKAAAGQRDFGF